MDAKEFARFFGGFSTEKRVKLIRTLMEAGRPGLSLIDLSRKTDLSVIDIGIAAEALLLMGLVDIKIKGENKMLFLNFDLISKIFDEAYHTFGAGRFLVAKEVIEDDPSAAPDNTNTTADPASSGS